MTRFLALPNRQAALWLAIATLIFSAGLYRLWPLTIDDAFISARYARNLATGHGLVFNPGSAPTEGYSNLTLVLLTAICTRLGAEAITAAKIIAALSGYLCLLLAALSGRLVLPRSYPFVVLLCATSFPLMVWSVAGLETSLMAAFVALWLYLALRLMLLDDRRTFWPLSAVAVLAALTRPEGVLLLGSLAALLARAPVRDRSGWWALTAGLALLLVHELWRLSYFGRLLPLPFYAKVDVGSTLAKLSGLYYLHAFLWSCAGGLVAYLALLFPLIQRRYAPDAPRWPLAPLLTIAPFLLFVAAVGADWMPQYRFMVPALVPLVLLLIALLESLSTALPAATPRARTFFFGCAVAVLCLGNAAGVWRGMLREDYHSTKMERLDIHWGASDALREQGLWLRDHGGSSLVVAALDIGAPAYYSDAHFIDLHGLTNPDLAGKSGEEAAEYFLKRRPDFVQVYGHAVERRPEFKRDYVRTNVPWNLFARRPEAR